MCSLTVECVLIHGRVGDSERTRAQSAREPLTAERTRAFDGRVSNALFPLFLLLLFMFFMCLCPYVCADMCPNMCLCPYVCAYMCPNMCLCADMCASMCRSREALLDKRAYMCRVGAGKLYSINEGNRCTYVCADMEQGSSTR